MLTNSNKLITKEKRKECKRQAERREKGWCDEAKVLLPLNKQPLLTTDTDIRF